MQEDGFICDKIILTKDSNYTPSGLGPAESLFVIKNHRIELPLDDWLGNLDPQGDSNRDGIGNNMAWALGASSPFADTTGILPSGSLSNDSNYFIFEYRRNDSADQDPNTIIKAQYSNELYKWETAVHDGNNIIISEFNDFYGNGIDKVEVSIKLTMSVEGQLFTRMSVTINE